MYKYIEIVEKSTNKATPRIDVTGGSERGIERVEDGVNINLNHNEFYTRITESEIKLDLEPQ